MELGLGPIAAREEAWRCKEAIDARMSGTLAEMLWHEACCFLLRHCVLPCKEQCRLEGLAPGLSPGLPEAHHWS